MMKQAAKPDPEAEEAWAAAERALEEARQMPAGPGRFEALKRVGSLRYEASKRMILATENTRDE